MVKVSVLMPVYNLEDYIEHAMESLFNQTLKDIEIVCVNDGSVDNSLEILKEFESKYDFIKVFSQENKGAGPALNKCIEEASGEYIAFLDADDIYVDDDALEKMYNYAIENDADFVAGNLKFTEPDYTIIDSDHYKRKLYKFCDKKGVLAPDKYGIPYAFYKNIFKRQFLNENNIRFPPYKRGVDTLFLARALTSTSKIYTIPVWLYGYNHSIGGGFNRKLSDYDFIRNFFKVFKGVFDVFEEAGFDKTNHKFKKELFLYLDFEDNSKDFEIYKILIEVFGDDGYYFKDYKNEYELFVAKQYVNRLAENRSEDLLIETKEKISQLDFMDNNLISKDLLKKFYIILESSSIEEFNQNYLEISYFNLEKEKKKLIKQNKKLIKKNNKIIKQNKKLKKQLKKENKEYKKIVSSSSWKITKPLRSLKRIFK